MLARLGEDKFLDDYDPGFLDKFSVKDIYSSMFSNATSGGCYNPKFSAAQARLKVLQSMAAMAGMMDDAPRLVDGSRAEDILERAGRCHWFCAQLSFSSDDDDYSSGSLFACVHPDLRTIGVVAWTDSS